MSGYLLIELRGAGSWGKNVWKNHLNDRFPSGYVGSNTYQASRKGNVHLGYPTMQKLLQLNLLPA